MNVAHSHCPYDCEHPQPFCRGNEEFCGRCWVQDGEYVRMIPCTPETCEEFTKEDILETA